MYYSPKQRIVYKKLIRYDLVLSNEMQNKDLNFNNSLFNE